MKNSTEKIFENLFTRYSELESIREELRQSIMMLISSFSNAGKLFVCGNGGSCSDSSHITGELVKSFRIARKIQSEDAKELCLFSDGDFLISKLQRGLPCIDLTANVALQTAISNDTSADLIFAQQLFVYGRPEDVLLALTTSGNSRNVCLAAQVAKSKKMKIIGLQGTNKASNLSRLADVLIAVPEKETFLVQELHLPIYHVICLCLENEFFGEE